MTAFDFPVSARKWVEIEEIAEDFRISTLRLMGRPELAVFPVMDVLEKVMPRVFDDFTFEIGDDEYMEGAEGLTDPKDLSIALREDVVQLAYGGQGRARFTAAHELGHLFLHGGTKLARKSVDHIPRYCRAEKQADQFAGCLLMPRSLISLGDKPEALVTRFGVSFQAAEIRLSKVWPMNRKTTNLGGNPGSSFS
jgi:hypothetical protein